MDFIPLPVITMTTDHSPSMTHLPQPLQFPANDNAAADAEDALL